MSDLVQLSQGFMPWAPSPGAEVVDVYHEYDRPLMGVFRQADGSLYFFECIAGEADPWGFWLYSHIAETEKNRLDSADGDTFDRQWVSIRMSRPCRVAIATDQGGIILYSSAMDVNTGFTNGIKELISRFDEYLASLESAKVEIDRQSDTNWEAVAAAG